MKRVLPGLLFLMAFTALAGYPSRGQDNSAAPSGRFLPSSSDPGVAPLATFRSPFGAEPVFEKPLTLAVKEQSLGEWLDGLRRTERLPVRADPSTQDERMTLFCKGKPAGEILAAVARHFDYTWVRRPHGETTGYFLTQSREQREREARLRAEAWAYSTDRLKKKVEQRLAEARRPVEERRQRKFERLRERLAADQNPERRPSTERFLEWVEGDTGRITWGDDPYVDVDAACLALRPEDWDHLWQGVPVRLGLGAGGRRTAISAEQATRLVRTILEKFAMYINGQPAPPPVDLTRVERAQSELSLELLDGTVTLVCRTSYRARQTNGWTVGNSTSLLTADSGRTEVTPPPVVDAGDPELRRVIRVQVKAGTGSDEEQYDLVGFLERLSPALPYVVIADAYDPARTLRPPAAGTQRLDQWLEPWCERMGVRVSRSGNALHFRRWDRARLRPLQVPERVTKPWEAELKRLSGPRLRTLAEMASRLSEEQLNWVLARWERQERIPADASFILSHNLRGGGGQRQMLGVLGALTPAEWRRATATNGGGLPLSRPALRETLLDGFHQPPGSSTQSFVPNDGPGVARQPLMALEAIEQGAAIPVLRARARAGNAYFAAGGFWDSDLEETLAVVRQSFDPAATPKSLRPVPLTRWRLETLMPVTPPTELTSTEVLTAPGDRGNLFSTGRQ